MSNGGKMVHDPDELLFLDEEETEEKNNHELEKKWKILIADDEEEVHNITKMVLKDFSFCGSGLFFFSAYSGQETVEFIKNNPDIAVILLDVVMESDDAGLEAVKYIRNELSNNMVQIVLRTGQAGQAPEHEVVEKYEINDYKTKYELTVQKLFTSMTSSLRAYHLASSFNEVNAQLSSELLQRKKAEEKIRNLSQFQESVIDNAEIWLNVTDADSNMVIWNKAAERISGFSKEEVLGNSNIWKLLFPDKIYYNSIVMGLDDVIKGNSEIKSTEAVIERKDGETRVILWNAKSFFDDKNNPLGIIALGQDITEKKELETKLAQAQKMEAVGRLAGGVAHDFNNILTVISGFSELSLLGLEADDPLRENLAEIKQASERAESLTRQLLAFSRQQIINPSVIDLRILFSDMQKMLIRLIGEDIELTTEYDENLYSIKADPGSIEQIFMNLIVNSRDSMTEGGKISIKMKNVFGDIDNPNKSSVLISVSDTGKGMDSETKQKIFEPFFTTKDIGRGTGLGLSMVYGIVTQIGGEIIVESSPGKGSTFNITIPSIPEENTDAVKEVEIEKAGGTETVLLVEDQPDVLNLTARMLMVGGFNVLKAGNGTDAIVISENNSDSIDIVISDVVMPGMSGKQLAKKLQKIIPEAPVLFMSGYSDNIIESKGVIDKSINFIRKPFSFEDLNRTVRKILDFK